ncbi:MAG TPA: CopD family protein [Sphingobacteriaceae bacterium]|nr:CopD family protein [Sphingobacteriaceae bacterium]
MAPLAFLGKFLQVSGVFFLVGGGVAAPWVMEPLDRGPRRRPSGGRPVAAGRPPAAGIVLVGAGLVLLGPILTAAATTAGLQRQPGLGAFLQTLAIVLTRTGVGRVWLAGTLVALLLLGTAAAGRRTRGQGGRPIPPAVFHVLFLAAILLQSGGGHARTGSMPWLSWAATGAHLIAAAAWGGTLWLLALLPWRRLARSPAVSLASLNQLLLRMSRLGTGVVAVFLLTGTALALWYGLRPATMFTTVYGQSLAAKLVLFVLTGGTALINRWLLMPQLERLPAHDGAPSPRDRARLVRAVGLVLRLEAVGVLLVAAVTAWLTQQPPPM